MSEGRDFTTIHRELRERIALLAYPPGGLLSENRLAKEFGVSRTPIRRVLHRLEFDGLVRIERGVGTIVAPIDMVYLKQVYDLRLKLIDVIADLDPVDASEEEIRILRGLRDQVASMRDGGEPQELARAYLRFNETVTRVIGNEPLREIADRLFYLTSRVWLQALPALDWPQEVGIVAQEIRETATALSAGDMRAVAESRRHHMLDCIHRVNAYLGSFETAQHPAQARPASARSRRDGPEGGTP